jgi:aminopeptidase N
VMQKIQRVLYEGLGEFVLAFEGICCLDCSIEVFGEGSSEHEANQQPRYLQQGAETGRLKLKFSASTPYSERTAHNAYATTTQKTRIQTQFEVWLKI